MFPAIDLGALNSTWAPTWQPMLLRQLRGHLGQLLRRSNSLKEKLAGSRLVETEVSRHGETSMLKWI